MELNMSLKQTQTLSPQMLQSMEILQMGSQELLQYIEKIVLENPVLEQEELKLPNEEMHLLRRKAEWLAETDTQNSYYQRQDAEDEEQDASSSEEWDENLYSYVRAQLQMLELSPDVMGAAQFITESLNGSGRLEENTDTLAKSYGCSEGCMERALEAVQSLEPAGVAARSLKECLSLQLTRLAAEHALALRIVDGYLEALAKSRYGLIAKSLGTTQENVRSACELIKTLNPKPGTGFSARESTTYISPDIFVVSAGERFELQTNDYMFPSLRMSAYYQSLAKDTEDPAVREYLDRKLRQAKWAVKSIEQRRSTILECAKYILERQESFFRKGAGFLLPMSLADIAAKLGVHESTVSRAIRDKYLQCDSGVYPLSYFFSRGLGTQSGDTADEMPSPDSAKALLKRLIMGENPAKPLSDQKLCQLMSQENCPISRRTVAKYRDELNIQSTTGRKKY